VARGVDRHIEARLREHLAVLYGARGVPVLERLLKRLAALAARDRSRDGARARLSEKTSVLITYADQITEPGIAPLHSLTETLKQTVGGLISHVHVLPFMPSSSDAGFSVMDFDRVEPSFGVWGDLRRLARQFGLMVDLVMNHVSARGEWFKRFLAGDPAYANFFLTVDERADLSAVVRPRARPLLTPFETFGGRRLVWTTFSPDQVDLNYANPDVLLRMIDVLLSLVRHGASIVRLDAIAFLWKRIGTPCVHLEETHWIVKLLRAVLDAAAPNVLLITETNVPHAENVSYLGDGTDEAQLVYQFPLPPLVVDAFSRQDVGALSAWARSLDRPPAGCTFLNFLASHDGIGLRPLEGLVDASRVEALVAQTLERGGRVSYRDRGDGTQSPYELNISLFDALSDPTSSEPLDRQIERFLTAHAVMLSLAGVPAIYVHSLFGSRSWIEGAIARNDYRAINRERFDRSRLLGELAERESVRARVFDGLKGLLRARAGHPAFHPGIGQDILALGRGVFGVLRGSADEGRILCLHNVTDAKQSVSAPVVEDATWTDLLSGGRVAVGDGADLVLAPLETRWLAKGSP